MQNDFAHSTSADNRVFTINDPSATVKAGQKLNVGFFAKSTAKLRIPLVAGIKFNDKSICPEGGDGDDESIEEIGGDTRCAKLVMKDATDAGRWDGILTVYPLAARNGIQVDIELDEPAWALGVRRHFSWWKVLTRICFTFRTI